MTPEELQKEIEAQKDKTVHGDYRMKYLVLEKKDADGKEVLFKDDKGFEWHAESFVTDVQVSDENARKAVEAGELQVVDGVLPEMKVE